MDPLPHINKVFSLVVQHERQREISGSLSTMHHNAFALMTKIPSPSPPSFAQPAAANSSNPRYIKPNVVRKDRPTCTHCGVYGHTVEKCYKLHGLPPSFKFTKGKLAEEQHSANQASKVDPSSVTLPIIQ
jgi:hypothetical protein